MWGDRCANGTQYWGPAVGHPPKNHVAFLYAAHNNGLPARAEHRSIVIATPPRHNVVGVTADRDEEFSRYVAERSGALLRVAYLLTGNRADAEDLLQTALAKTYLSWHRIQDKGALDGYVRRVLVNTQTSWWRKRRVEEYPTDQLPEQAWEDTRPSEIELRSTVWKSLAQLPRRQRAVVVL